MCGSAKSCIIDIVDESMRRMRVENSRERLKSLESGVKSLGWYYIECDAVRGSIMTNAKRW